MERGELQAVVTKTSATTSYKTTSLSNFSIDRVKFARMSPVKYLYGLIPRAYLTGSLQIYVKEMKTLAMVRYHNKALSFF